MKLFGLICAVMLSLSASAETVIAGGAVTEATLKAMKSDAGLSACAVPEAKAVNTLACSAQCVGQLESWVKAKDAKAQGLIAQVFKGSAQSLNPETALAVFLPVTQQIA